MIEVDYDKLNYEINRLSKSLYSPGYKTSIYCLRASLKGKRHIKEIKLSTLYRLGGLIRYWTIDKGNSYLKPLKPKGDMRRYELSQEGNDILGSRVLYKFLKSAMRPHE